MRITDLNEKDIEKKSLYLSRKVKNGNEIVEWAKEQGFTSILDPDDMHVTIAFSDAPIDWDAMGDSYKNIKVKKPMTRSIQMFDGGAVVLTLENGDLGRRWQEAIDLGASWSYEDYSPHVTLSYSGADGIDITDIKPFGEDIILGEEIFKEVDHKWKNKVKEKGLDGAGLGDDDLPEAYWFHAERKTYIECTDHAEYVSNHYRKMKLDPTEVSEIISADDDESLTEIESEELCDLAIENGWVIGRKSHINAGDIDDLRSAAEFFADKWPDHTAKLILRHSWEHVFEPPMLEEFTKHGMLPESVQDTDNLPRKFWLVFNIPSRDQVGGDHASETQEIFNGLRRGKLRGLKGISGSREIITDWLHVGRNAALVMDSQKVFAENDILRVNYADPDALLENSMSAIYRLFNRSHNRLGHMGLMQNIFRYFITEISTVDVAMGQELRYYGFETQVADYYAEKQQSEEDFRISTLDELTDFIIEAMSAVADGGGRWRSHLSGMFSDVDRAKIQGAVRQAVMNIGTIYSSESEWIVKNDVFSVPKGSVMLILADKRAIAKYDDWLKQPDGYKFMPSLRFGLERLDHTLDVIRKYDLEDRYTVKMIDEMHFSKIRSEVADRRRARRADK